MTDEVNWSDACRRVAEWMGEVERIYPSDLGDHHMILSESTNADGMYEQWPDYTRDDAAAMRLQQRLPIGIERDPPSQSRYQATLTVDQLRDGRWDVYYPGWDEGYWTCGARHEDLRKALVLAACKLIDMGVEPKEVAR